MDFTLRCNSLACRAQLDDLAIVTTCSHIFCLSCADILGLASASPANRPCPACKIKLPNVEDVVQTRLNPSEDYKTSVLSGLSPAIITECAGRALAFWNYQSSQEIIYQEYFAKKLTQSYDNLKAQLDNIIADANAQIEGLSTQLQEAYRQNDLFKTEVFKARGEAKEKDKQLQHAKDLNRRYKAQQQTEATQAAAFDSAESIINADHNGEYSQLGGTPLSQPSVTGALHSRMHDVSIATPQHQNRRPVGNMDPSVSLRAKAAHNNWQSQGHPSQSQRQPLAPISGNTQRRGAGTPGSGWTSGMKQSTPQYNRNAQYEGRQSYDVL